MIPFMAIGQMATSKTGRVLMVAIIAHDLRRWEVFDVGNPFGGVWYIRTRSESHSWPSSEKGWTGRIKGNVRPVHHNLRIPATVSLFLAFVTTGTASIDVRLGTQPLLAGVDVELRHGHGIPEK